MIADPFFAAILFHTTTSALRSEKLLKKAGLEIKLVPTPRHLSSDCGIAIRCLWIERQIAQGILSSAGVEHEVHSLDEMI